MARIELVPVRSRRDLGRFVDVQVHLHRDAPGFVAPLRMAELETLDQERNPFYRHARLDAWLALRDGRPVGRIACIDDDRHNEVHGDDLAFFGYFDAADATVAAALLARVEARAREIGRSVLRGPVNPSMNDSAGVQLDGFDVPPAVMMPWNPPSYPAWIEAAGFAKAKDLEAWLAEEERGIPERFGRLAQRAAQRSGAVVREVRMDRFDQELAVVQEIYQEAWERNWGQVSYTDAEFEHLARTLRLILDPRIALFLELKSEVVAIAIALPDLNQVLARFSGRLLPFGIVPFLRRRRIMNRIRLAILGVRPPYRHRGLELVLIHEIWRRGVAAGYRAAELSWILEDNEALLKGLRTLGARRIKTYRIYQKPLHDPTPPA